MKIINWNKRLFIGIILSVLNITNSYATGSGTTSPSTTPVDPASSTSSSDNSLIKYIEATLQTRNQAEAEYVFMEPPGHTDKVKDNGEIIGAVSQQLEELAKKKELEGINWGLYGTLRPNDNKEINGSLYSRFLDRHKEKFCSPDSGVEKSLDDKTCTTDSSKQHADLRISSLLNPTIYNTNAEADEWRIAGDVIDLVISGFPTGADRINDLMSGGLKGNKAKQTVADAMANQATLGVARNSLIVSHSMRTPIGNGRSLLSTIENETTRRFKGDGDWYKGIEKSSGEALLRELAHMQAVNLWLGYQKFKQNERIETLLAVLIANNVNQMGKLNDMLNQASNSVTTAVGQ